MFRQLFQKMGAWAGTVDILGSDLAEDELEPRPFEHPHRRPVARRLQRRAGTVPARPAVCVSPVRPIADLRRDPAPRP